MKLRFMGISGVLLVLAALILGSLGPSLWPSAFWSSPYSEMNGPSMLGSGMMGMMNGGTANSSMMGRSMMNGGMMSDSNARFDQRFLDQMIMHHQGAVMSAQMMIADSARPELRDLAQRIITAQQREIDQMRAWRQDWYGAANSGTPPSIMSGMMSGAMMSRDQMRQMMGASVDFDRIFLQMMIPHHEAAIAMAQQALTQVEHPEITTLAQRIIATQRTEIEEMQKYLRDWYDTANQ